MRWSRHPVGNDDDFRFYYVPKAVKDYLVETGKTSFTYNEVSEMIETKSILCFLNDLIRQCLIDWVVFQEKNMCQHSQVDCSKDSDPTEDWNRMLGYVMLIPAYPQIAHFISNNRDSTLMFEAVLAYDDWEVYHPIITA